MFSGIVRVQVSFIDFVNSGGGLFASHNSYGWLTALLPSAVYNNGGCNGGPDATSDGTTDFGLTNSIVAACWHGYFTGNVGTLKTLVDYPYPALSSPRRDSRSKYFQEIILSK